MTDFGIVNECMIDGCPHNRDGECQTDIDITLSGFCDVYEAWAKTGEWPRPEPPSVFRCDYCGREEYWAVNSPESKPCTGKVLGFDDGRNYWYPCKGRMTRQYRDDDV